MIFFPEVCVKVYSYTSAVTMLNMSLLDEWGDIFRPILVQPLVGSGLIIYIEHIVIVIVFLEVCVRVY